MGQISWERLSRMQVLDIVNEIVDPVESRVSVLESDVSGIESLISTIETDISTIETDISIIETDISTIETNVSNRVISPATNSADYIPQWNGANSKTLKNGVALTSLANVTSGSGAPATTPSAVGQIYIDTTAKRKYISTGTSSSADWLKEPVFYSGTATITNADVTITLPWDWSGGRLEVFYSTNTSYWAGPGTYNYYSTSYDALTGAGYTTNNMVANLNGTGVITTLVKTTNAVGCPKSATSTTFVLDNDGGTGYVKYFVWA